jgi:hypothetical protein
MIEKSAWWGWVNNPSKKPSKRLPEKPWKRSPVRPHLKKQHPEKDTMAN